MNIIETYEKVKAYIVQPLPYLFCLHCVTVICLWLLTKATDYTFSLALTGQLSEVAIMVFIFLYNTASFYTVAVVILKTINKLYEFIPEEQLFAYDEESDEEALELTVTVPMKQLLFIIVITAATAIAIALVFYNHIGFSRRLYNCSDNSLFVIDTISL